MIDRDQLTAALADRFEFLGTLGQGGMGVVLRARQKSLGREVAVKIATLSDPGMGVRFRAEARALSQLEHPAIVRLLDADLQGDVPYFVMELVPGVSLRDRLEAGSLGVDDALRIAAALAGALGFAHGQGFVHRDLKPENVLIGPDGSPKLMDFGIARWIGAPVHHSIPRTAAGVALGSPHYMAPEQILGNDIGPATDVYGLGVTLYETLTGHFPFESAEMIEVLRAHVYSAPAAPSTLSPHLPAAVDAVVLEMLEKDPARRPKSGPGLEKRLLGAAREVGEPARVRPRSAAARPAVTKQARRPAPRPSRWAIPVGGVLGLCGVAAFLAASRPPTAPRPPTPASVRAVESKAPPLLKTPHTRVAQLERVLLDPLRIEPVPRALDLALAMGGGLAFDVVVPPVTTGGCELELRVSAAVEFVGGVNPSLSVKIAGDVQPLVSSKPSRNETLLRLVTGLSPGWNRLELIPQDGGIRLNSIAVVPKGSLAPVTMSPDHAREDLAGADQLAFQKGKQAFENEQWAECVAAYDPLVRTHRWIPGVRLACAAAERHLQHFERAMLILDEWVRMSPGTTSAVDAYDELAATLCDQNRFAEARRLAIHTLRARPDDVKNWLYLARAEQGLKLKDALEDFEWAAVIKPDTSEPIAGQMEVLESQGRFQEAGRRGQAYLDKHPGQATEFLQSLHIPKR